MQNKLTDLHNHLFAELERLSDEDLKGEKLLTECKRAEAISKVSHEIISNASTMLRAMKMKDDMAAGLDNEQIFLGTTSSGKPTIPQSHVKALNISEKR